MARASPWRNWRTNAIAMLPSPSEATPLTGLVMTRAWRLVAAGLSVVSRGSLVVFAIACVLAPGAVPSGALLRAVAMLWLVPELAAWMLRRAHAAAFTIRDDLLVVRASAETLEVPLVAVATVVAWRIPLPQPGCSIVLRSGDSLPEGLMPADPAAFLRALAEGGVPDAVVAPVRQHPSTVYGTAKAAARSHLDHPFVKFGLFSLVPVLPLFRLRQYIVYGGTFGEYYQYGLRVYVLGFTLFWLLYAVYLLLYAAGLRALTELVALAAAWSAPARASRVRRVAETLHRVFYYIGVPAVLAIRLFPW
jgi:apolipoprotein N-acyltransferase